MKKISSIALAAIACWGMSSCDPFTMPNPPAQVNPDANEVVFNADDLVLTSTVGGEINLGDAMAQQKPVELFTYTVKDFPATSQLKIVAEFAKDADFADVVEMPTTLTDDGKVTVSAFEFSNMLRNNFTKAPDAITLDVRFPAYAVNGNTSVRLGGPDKYYFTGAYIIKPVEPEVVIEDHYYLVGDFCGWDVAKAIEMNQLTPGNPYDNPDFTLALEIGETEMKDGKCTFLVLPESVYKAGNLVGAYGIQSPTVGAAETTGSLAVYPGTGVEMMSITTEGSYMVKINLQSMKVAVAVAPKFLWIPAGGQSTTNFDAMMRLTTTDYVNYGGSAVLKNSFWFTGQPNLRGIVYRPDGDGFTDPETGVYSGLMMMDNAGSAKMRVSMNALYYITANLATLEYVATPIPEIDLVGAFNNWKEKESLPLTPSADFKTWTITNVELPADEFKFCVSKSWALSYGRDDELSATISSHNAIIKQNGGNFKIETAGTYDITLSFANFPPVMILTKK